MGLIKMRSIRKTRAGPHFSFQFLSFLLLMDAPVVVYPWVSISPTYISALRDLSSVISAIVSTFRPHHVDDGPNDPVDSSDSATGPRL